MLVKIQDYKPGFTRIDENGHFNGTYWETKRRYRFTFSYPGHDGPTMAVFFRFDYSGEEYEPEMEMWKDGEVTHIFSDDKFQEMIAAYEEHEGHEPDDKWLEDKADYKWLRMMGYVMWKPEDIIKAAKARWDAICLLVNPEVAD